MLVSVSDRHGRVVVAVTAAQTQGNPSSVVASIPAGRHAIVEDRWAIDPAQAVVGSVKSYPVVVAAVIDELGVYQFAVFVVQ